MKTIEDLIRKDVEWHQSQNPPDHAVGIEYAAGFLAGLKHALTLVERIPDWEDVSDKLMAALTIYGEVLESMPCSVDDMIADDDKNAAVDAACAAYESAHLLSGS